MLRVAPNSLAPTIIRHLLFRATQEAGSQGRRVIRVADTHTQPELELALRELSFRQHGESYYKLSIAQAMSTEHWVKYLTALDVSDLDVRQFARDLARRLSVRSVCDDRLAYEIERVLWPGKVVDATIPSYIVSIKPHWAQHLFDPSLARQTLFGARVDLALSQEAVYYRSARPSGSLRAPGRILWYVSMDSQYAGAGQLRACSSLDTVIIDTPKELYRKFRRLGVYEWSNVYGIAGQNVQRAIMALHFSRSELLANPIPWEALQRILRAAGINTQLQSPTQIPGEVFNQLYQGGGRAG